MKREFVLKLLKKELKEWEKRLASDKVYYKGAEKDKRAIYDFKESNLRISELKKAIEILEQSSVPKKRTIQK